VGTKKCRSRGTPKAPNKTAHGNPKR
jgi:hypothetical protein